MSSHTLTFGGSGAVSSAGWGVDALLAAVLGDSPPPPVSQLLSGVADAPRPLPALRVPKPDPRPAFLAHPRLRRASPIAQFAAAAALEALGEERLAALRAGTRRTGIVFTLLNGCVNYSSRFYTEVIADPATASPILFPETVFNAPSSHIAALLGITAPSYSVVGDTAQFFPALELAAGWILDGTVDDCLVIAAEETDWLTADALRLLAPGAVLSEGAAAVLLEKNGTGPALTEVFGPVSIASGRGRFQAAEDLRSLCAADPSVSGSTLLVSDESGSPRADAPSSRAFADWCGPVLHPREILGESLGAGAALQTVIALESVRRGRVPSALAVAVGGDQQAAGCLIGA